MKFSERIGAKQRVIQKDSMDDDLRNALWNAAYSRYWSYYADKQHQHADYVKEGQLLCALWTKHFGQRQDEFPEFFPTALRAIKRLFAMSEWASVYDFIEFIATCGVVESGPFIADCNEALGEHSSAYRFAGNTLVLTTPERGISAAEHAARRRAQGQQVPVQPEPASDDPESAVPPVPRPTFADQHRSAQGLNRPTLTSVQAGIDLVTKSQVFVSYSWDSEPHKEWVLNLATNLRTAGIDVILDRWHLELGGRSPEFMERAVRDSDFVLVICTEGYKSRFDNRTGGAGYEGHIITGEIVHEVGENKFIPILRHGNWKSAVPTALAGVHGVDLSEDSATEYDRLLNHLLGVRDIPPLGVRPDLARSDV